VSKKIKILILCSLLLNVLLIGIIVGHLSHRITGEESLRRRAPDLAVKLPPDKKVLFLETMKRVRRENRHIHRQIREARKRTLSILTAPEFNEASYQREVEKLHNLRGLMMQRLAEASKELAKKFNRGERKALAEFLRRPPLSPREARIPHRADPPPHKEGLPSHRLP
jgi:uncharacterized membrane protein